MYRIAVIRSGRSALTLDGVEQPESAIPLVDDRREHQVEVGLS